MFHQALCQSVPVLSAVIGSDYVNVYQYTYLDAAGNPLRLGVGPSYINIVGRSATVTVG